MLLGESRASAAEGVFPHLPKKQARLLHSPSHSSIAAPQPSPFIKSIAKPPPDSALLRKTGCRRGANSVAACLDRDLTLVVFSSPHAPTFQSAALLIPWNLPKTY